MLRTLSFEYVLTPRGLEKHCRIACDAAGRISAIESGAAGPWDGGLALPGMPNAHSHAFQRALTCSGESTTAGSFWSWRDTMYRVANALEAEDLYVIAVRAFTDMLCAGFTSVGEFHYVHHARDGSRTLDMAQAIREAARDAGIRLMLLPVLYQRGGFDRAPAPEQRRFIHESLEEFGQLLEALRGEPCGIAPHSLRAVPLEHLGSLVALADRVLGAEAPIHIHVSEQRREVEECRAKYGRTPIQCLADTVELGSRWSLVHATHAEPAELALLRESEANLVLCPLTEAYLGDGLFPFEHAPAMPFAIGSDSNARIDAIDELRWAEYGQRLKLERRTVLGGAGGLGAPLWCSAAEAGARSLRLPVGHIEVGAFADFTVLDAHDPLFAGVRPEHLLDAWIVGGSAAQIASVYVGGGRRIEHGEAVFATADERFAATMLRLQGEAR